MSLRKCVAGSVAALLAGFVSIGTAHAAQAEHVLLWNNDGTMGISASSTELHAGTVKFDVTNKASDALQHEMIVLKLTPEQAANPNSLPYNDKTATFDEEAVNDKGEVSELNPGRTGSLTLDLNPGTYMLACNVPGHYKAGMYTIVHVN